MSNIFTLSKIEDIDTHQKINLDDLFEKKKQHDLDEVRLFNKILNRIHSKIILTSRQKVNEQFLWFVVPQFILGYTKYNQAHCIVYVIDKLKENNLLIKYYHPSLLYIYWGHWCPKYMRDEIKSKLGIQVNEYGVKIEENDEGEYEKMGMNNYNEKIFKKENKKDSYQQQSSKKNNNEKYTNINSYNPTGNLTYNKILREWENDDDNET